MYIYLHIHEPGAILLRGILTAKGKVEGNDKCKCSALRLIALLCSALLCIGLLALLCFVSLCVAVLCIVLLCKLSHVTKSRYM